MISTIKFSPSLTARDRVPRVEARRSIRTLDYPFVVSRARPIRDETLFTNKVGRIIM